MNTSMTCPEKIEIAYFISAHGFGHAARSAAVMAAIAKKIPGVHFLIFTGAPRWFFAESLTSPFRLVHEKTDIGLIQRTPLEQDLDATLAALDQFLPFDTHKIQSLAEAMRHTACRLAICDISPLGIMAAAAANIPSILVENFTWDWIYDEYALSRPGFNKHIAYLKHIFAQATYHIQTEPVCVHHPDAHLVTFPVSRKPKSTRQQVRSRLKVTSQEKIALVTMGGIPENFSKLDAIHLPDNYRLVIPGGHADYSRSDHLILLPHHSEFYHPDLVFSSDAVIGKAGYSTIAEVYHSGIPFAYISRSNFRESPPLGEYIQREMGGIQITEQEFRQNTWVKILPSLFAKPLASRQKPNGADQIARFVRSMLL